MRTGIGTPASDADRSDWGIGPWDGEPDRLEFTSLGLPCLMRRGFSGAWCGYVAVPKGHPWHGKGYEADGPDGLDIHGGLTYASACAGPVCHVPAPGEPDDVWWFGFDCAHSGDLVPLLVMTMAVLADLPGYRSVYRDVAYVRAQVESLAEQLAGVNL